MKNIGFIKAAQDIEQTEQMLNLMKEHILLTMLSGIFMI